VFNQVSAAGLEFQADLENRKRWFALALIVAAQFMVVLDVAIVNVALPSIRTDLHFSQESLQWVVTAYGITSQQIGGAIGVAAATTIATTFTNRYVDAHVGATPLGGGALTRGFQVTFYVLAVIAALGAVAAAVLTESHPSVPDAAEVEDEPLLEAA
jgi:MFS family permease